MLISTAFWMQGRQEPAAEHAERAMALLPHAEPSRSVVWVLQRLASRASLAGQHERALEIVTQTRALAEQLGWEAGLSEALSLLGLTRLNLGDPSGLDDVEQSIEVAAAAEAFDALARGYNALAVAQQMLGNLEAGYVARLEGARLAERIGFPAWTRWFKGVLVDHRYRRGEWDEALRSAGEFIAEIDAGSLHYSSFQIYTVRAEMRSARGDSAGAIRDAERALAAGRALDDPQALLFVLAGCAHLFVLESVNDRAVALARELLAALDRGVQLQFAVINLPAFVSALVTLESAAELVGALAGQLETPWMDAVRAYAQGDFAAAAEILHRTGSRPEEAEARLRAAEQLVAAGRPGEADQQLQQALAFYRSVNATRFVHECEALLTASPARE
jgi:tetratricopeptide (TPR) repeat protein